MDEATPMPTTFLESQIGLYGQPFHYMENESEIRLIELRVERRLLL